MAASLRCNVCWRPLRLCLAPVFSSCGHIVCEACRTFQPGDNTCCPVCKSPCATIPIPPTISKLPSSVRWCFESPDTLLSKVSECLRFQHAHEQSYTHALRKQLRIAQSAASEAAQLTLENTKLREREKELHREVRRLKDKLQQYEDTIAKLKLSINGNSNGNNNDNIDDINGPTGNFLIPRSNSVRYLTEERGSASEAVFNQGVKSMTRASPMRRRSISKTTLGLTNTTSPAVNGSNRTNSNNTTDQFRFRFIHNASPSASMDINIPVQASTTAVSTTTKRRALSPSISPDIRRTARGHDAILDSGPSSRRFDALRRNLQG